ncbi:GspE/PulE family protein [Methylophilus sp. VKM B-3414]|uniref:GspE/PulE family protein n=1 Tax=Methylophilus sp. VKM B-3414 TaxID=3076121 RepID=UPI0028C56E4F|nr:GspE/PulE family protein [Methylophilus sp. VKM B-3414]MDT7848705.1 GspE/PulE family protein [Methylophilus sp. VKM B-3414]
MRIGEWMLAKGMITSDQLDIALIEQRKQQLLLGQQLVRLHFVTDAMVRDVLAQLHVQESMDLQYVMPDPAWIAKVPETFARQHRLLPLDLTPDQQSLRIAVQDHQNAHAIEALKHLLGGGITLTPVLATEVQIEQALDRCYGHSLSLERLLQEIEQQEAAVSLSPVASASHPVIRLVDAILVDAVKQGASDIHFEPEQAFVRIRYRIDGVLWQIRCLHDRYWPAMCVRLKVLAGMDIAEQRMPQDGRVNLFLCGREVDFRVSSHPTLHGENLVLRVLDRHKSIIPLSQMGIRCAQLASLKAMLAKPEGLLIVTGPTGSGKTTTLYSMLGHLNQTGVNIMTLEDPVEYPHHLMRQTSVNEANKVDFVTGVRAILRQDPDIMLIGEVRDEATAAMAVRAAMTGHLVMTTLHTNHAAAAFLRLQDLGIQPHTLAGCLVGVIAQRLLRRLCQHCKRQASPDPHLLAMFQYIDSACIPESFTCFEAVGCQHCRQSGYQGRTVVMEILSMHSGLEEALTPLSLPRLQQNARSYGYTTLAEEGVRLVMAGETSLQELKRVVDLSVLEANVLDVSRPV